MTTTALTITILMIILIILTLFTAVYITVQNRILQRQVMDAIEEALYEYEEDTASRSLNTQVDYYNTLRNKLNERSKQEHISEHIDQVAEEFIDLMKHDIDILEERYEELDASRSDNTTDSLTENNKE